MFNCQWQRTQLIDLHFLVQVHLARTRLSNSAVAAIFSLEPWQGCSLPEA